MEKISTVAVLLSTYNGEKYLPELINSILIQNNVLIRLIVRDDGSSDGTTEILMRYQQRGDLEWCRGENRGYTESFMELCVHAPKADYYAFADQDDVWLPDKLENAVKQLCCYNDVPALCVSEWKMVDERLRPTFKPTKALGYSVEAMKHASEIDILKAACAMNHVTGSGCLQVWNNRLHMILSQYDYPHMPIGHDVIVGMTAVLCGRFIPYEQPGILYRQHSNNTSGGHGGWKAVRTRWITHFKRMQNKAGPNISECNAAILKAYTDVIPDNAREIITKTIVYKSNPAAKIELLFSDYPSLLYTKDRLKFRIKVLLNRL